MSARPTRDGAAAEWALGAFVLLTRVPFLFAGYGTDADAWGVVLAGRLMVRTGRYVAARAPGNPVPEFAAAALAGSPPWVLNAITALLGAAAVVLFARMLRRFGSRGWIAGALALAWTPAIAIHSVDNMDYVWALAFVLGAWLAVLDRRAALAGLLVGVATGCRITSSLMLLPLSLVLASEHAASPRERPRALAALWIAGAAASLAAFAPAIAASGLGFLHGYGSGYPRLLYVAKTATVDVWGVPGCLALAAAAVLALLRRGRAPADAMALPGAVTLAAALAVVLELAVFLRFPNDAGYLVPAVPFALLLAARVLSRREFAWVCALVVLSSFAVKVSDAGRLDAASAARPGFRLRVGHEALRVDLLRGPFLTEQDRRAGALRYAKGAIAAAQRLHGPAVIVADEWLPFVRVLSDDRVTGDATWVHSLSRAQVDSLVRRGVAIYDLPGAQTWAVQVRGYSLRAAGSRPLEVP